MARTAARISKALVSLAEVRRTLGELEGESATLVSRLTALERALAAEIALLKAGAGQYPARDALAVNLRRARRARGLSQELLADVAGLDRSYVSGIERGERNVGIDNVGRLASALEVSVAGLFAANAE